MNLGSAIPVRGRKAYGRWDSFSCSYHACYALLEDDCPEDQVWNVKSSPEGAVVVLGLKGADAVTRIGATFDALADDEALDGDRPRIEFHRRHDEIDLLVPIRSEPEATG